MKNLIRYAGAHGQFEYRFISSFAIITRKINKKIKYFIVAHTNAGTSEFSTSFNSLGDAENTLQLYFGIDHILVPDDSVE